MNSYLAMESGVTGNGRRRRSRQSSALRSLARPRLLAKAIGLEQLQESFANSSPIQEWMETETYTVDTVGAIEPAFDTGRYRGSIDRGQSDVLMRLRQIGRKVTGLSGLNWQRGHRDE